MSKPVPESFEPERLIELAEAVMRGSISVAGNDRRRSSSRSAGFSGPD